MFCSRVFQRGQFHKSHQFDVLHGNTATELKRDIQQNPRAFVPPSSFNGTAQLVDFQSNLVRDARSVSSSSDATSLTSSGAIPDPLEKNFTSAAYAASKDKYAHLRRAPVAKDFANTAEPLAHIQLMEPTVPSWVEYDRKVLRFSGYFKEAVHASSSESWRIRPILLYYYLEDDSIHIAEPTVANSGIPQGVFIKRHRIAKDEQGGTFTVDDLAVGVELPIYGRMFRLTAADPFTRAFYEKNGAPLGADESTPQDPFAKRSSERPALTHKKTLNADAEHAEAALGKRVHGGIAQTQKFLKNDGKVLRFYARWDDTKMYGEKRPYIIHYFLADDTVEVLEVSQPNSGHGSFPALLKRSKLPKDHTMVQRDVAHVGGNLRGEDPALLFVQETDLRVGGYLNVYGRDLLLLGADAFTKSYYIKTFGLTEEDFNDAGMKDPEETPYKIEVPPETGFGSDEASLSSFLYLVPMKPKTDQVKLHQMDGILLRFSAKFAKPAYVDRDRVFIITYYLANDTLQIFELFARNQGHIGGAAQKHSQRAGGGAGCAIRV